MKKMLIQNSCHNEPELDITPFLNLMIVLVPVLLINMVFNHITVLELNLPPVIQQAQDNPDDKPWQLEVHLYAGQMVLYDANRGPIDTIKNLDGRQNTQHLAKLLFEIKKALIDPKTDISLLVGADINYQQVVTVMDSLRSYPVVTAGSVTYYELFPDVSIGQAPTQLNKEPFSSN